MSFNFTIIIITVNIILQELINLLLTGKGTSNTFDGDLFIDSGYEQSVSLTSLLHILTTPIYSTH